MAPGKGCADFSVLKLLSGYRGVYNLEVFSLEHLLFGKETLENALSFKSKNCEKKRSQGTFTT